MPTRRIDAGITPSLSPEALRATEVYGPPGGYREAAIPSPGLYDAGAVYASQPVGYAPSLPWFEMPLPTTPPAADPQALLDLQREPAAEPASYEPWPVTPELMANLMAEASALESIAAGAEPASGHPDGHAAYDACIMTHELLDQAIQQGFDAQAPQPQFDPHALQEMYDEQMRLLMDQGMTGPQPPIGPGPG
jgi:hypothetical protein